MLPEQRGIVSVIACFSEDIGEEGWISNNLMQRLGLRATRDPNVEEQWDKLGRRSVKVLGMVKLQWTVHRKSEWTEFRVADNQPFEIYLDRRFSLGLPSSFEGKMNEAKTSQETKAQVPLKESSDSPVGSFDGLPELIDDSCAE